jgi:predicted metal-dependent hydrolase
MQQIELDLATFPFSFELKRSRRKTLVIYVKEGKVEVRAPLKASEKWIGRFLADKSAWIQTQLRQQRQKKQEALRLVDGSRIEVLGQALTLQVALGRQSKAQRSGGTVTLFVRASHKDKLEKAFMDWLLSEAQRYMPARVEHYARKLGLAHKLKAVTFRRTRTKWGHCCQDGTIQFNWLVMMAPPAVLEYLIAHETSHLRHLNHSKKFWETVGSLCPDYKQHRDWLSDHGHRLWPA